MIYKLKIDIEFESIALWHYRFWSSNFGQTCTQKFKKKTEVQNLQYHMKASEAHLHKEKWIKKIIKVSQPLQSMTEIACQMRQLWRACDMGIPLTLLTVLVTKGNGESLA